MYLYPDNLKAKAILWLWELRDIGIIGVGLLISVFALAQLRFLPPFVLTHHVYAELQTGEQVPVVTSLPRSYAHYIAHTLDNYLQDITGAAMPSGDDRLGDTAQPDTLDEDAPGYRQHWSD